MADDDDLNCRQASWLLSVARERPLSGVEAEALRQHLRECLACTQFEKQLKFLGEASKKFRGA
jgi:hypothetical protein